MNRCSPQKADLRGFTLLELLAAFAVFAILALIMVRIVSVVSDTWRAGRARVDNYSQARVTLGIIDRDVQSVVLRRDLSAFRDENGAPGVLAFYSRMLGEEGDRKLSLVEYRLTDVNSTPRLERVDYGLDYESLSPTRTMTLGNTASLPDLSKGLTQEIAEGVIAFGCEFMDRNGALSAEFKFDFDDPDAISNTPTLLVALVVLDAESYRLAKSTDTLPQLLAVLKTPPPSGMSYGEHWRAVVDSSSLGASLPRPVWRALRVFERSISIPLPR